MRLEWMVLAVTSGWLVAWTARGQETDPASPSASETSEPEVSVVVRAVPHLPNAGELGVGAAEARRGAGTQGDAAKVVQSLPGVSRTGLSEDDIVLWGALPEESRLYIDGVQVPRLFHTGGVRSVLSSERIAGVRVLPGGYGVEHGRGLGGVMELRTQPLDIYEPHAVVAADLLDTSVVGSSPVGDGTAAGVSARYGYVDRWLPRVLDGEASALYVIPSYFDGQVEVRRLLRTGEQLRVVALYSHDDAQWANGSADPYAAALEDRAATFHRWYALYELLNSDGSKTQVTPIVGWDESSLDGDYGTADARTDERGLRYGLRASHQRFVVDGVAVSLGFDAWGEASRVERAGSPMVPAREGDPYVFGRAPGDGYAADHYRTHQLDAGSYVEVDVPLGDWSVRPGLRVETMLLETSRKLPPLGSLPTPGTSAAYGLWEPRLGLAWRVSRAVSLEGFWGRYHQAPNPIDVGAIHGNPNLEPQTATHYVIGERAEVRHGLSFEWTAFYERLHNLVVRSSDPRPDTAELLVNGGEGRSYGTQVFLRRRPRDGLFGWLSASLSRSERRRSSDEAWRLVDYDRPLSLALVVAKELGSWTVSGRARFSSGPPRTAVIGTYYDLSHDTYQPIVNETSSKRLRPFFQCDLRIDRSVAISETIRAEAYLDLLNVTFRRNAEELAYSRDYRRMGTITGLPPMAIVGIRVER